MSKDAKGNVAPLDRELANMNLVVFTCLHTLVAELASFPVGGKVEIGPGAEGDGSITTMGGHGSIYPEQFPDLVEKAIRIKKLVNEGMSFGEIQRKIHDEATGTTQDASASAPDSTAIRVVRKRAPRERQGRPPKKAQTYPAE